MIHQKITQQVLKEHQAIEKEMAALQNKLVRLNLVEEVHRQGVARSNSVWFVDENVLKIRQ